MLYSKKCALFAVFANAQLALASNECVDIWAIGRCTSQKNKGNCVPEAQCPNPKKDGIKCTRARSKCMASCGLCDDDSTSSCAAQLAEKDAIIASMTSPPTSPPPSSPPPSPPSADHPCDTAYYLHTLTQAYDWCASNCDGRTVKVITDIRDEDVDYSDESGGVCAIADTTDAPFGIVIDITLTEHDDCFVIAGDRSFSSFGDGNELLGLGGNDALCGGSGGNYFFYGGDGDDILAVGGGGFYLEGDDGADKIFGGPGPNSWYDWDTPLLYGGWGEDSIYAVDTGDGAMDDDEFDEFYNGAGSDDESYDGDGAQNCHSSCATCDTSQDPFACLTCPSGQAPNDDDGDGAGCCGAGCDGDDGDDGYNDDGGYNDESYDSYSWWF